MCGVAKSENLVFEGRHGATPVKLCFISYSVALVILERSQHRATLIQRQYTAASSIALV